MKMKKKCLVALVAAAAIVLPLGTAGAVDIRIGDNSALDWLGNSNWTDTNVGGAAGQLSAIYGLGTTAATWSPNGGRGQQTGATSAANLPFNVNHGITMAAGSAPSGPGSTGFSPYDNDHTAPGYGQQNFDIEATYVYYDDDGGVSATSDGQGLYMGIWTGFNQAGEGSYTAGDLFLDFDNDNTWDIAIELNSGGTFGRVYGYLSGAATSWYTAPNQGFPGSTPYAINHANAREFTSAGEYGGLAGGTAYNADLTDTDLITPGLQNNDHNFIEAFLSEDFLQWGNTTYGWKLGGSTGGSVRTHWTMSCGNDTGEAVGGIPPGVPEPVTMGMLGCLGLGMFGARSLKKKAAKNA